MEEFTFHPIPVYRKIILKKTFAGWSAEVAGLPGTYVDKYRYKQDAFDQCVEKARTILERFDEPKG